MRISTPDDIQQAPTNVDTYVPYRSVYMYITDGCVDLDSLPIRSSHEDRIGLGNSEISRLYFAQCAVEKPGMHEWK